jgi:hypothetical protein
MSEHTERVLQQLTADMWSSAAPPEETPQIVHRKARARYLKASSVAATIGIVAVATAAEAHRRYPHVTVDQQMVCDDDVMHPCRMVGAQRAESPRRVRVAHHRERKQVAREAHVETGRGVVHTPSGAVAYVAERARTAFQCIVDKLETEGYHIHDIGGFARGGHIRHSLHYSGMAVDINQESRNVTHPKMPDNEIFLANSCGLISGAQWHDADSGHFQLGGYDGHTQVAARHHHRRHFAHRHIAHRYVIAYH